jgi:hypothetical protein
MAEIIGGQDTANNISYTTYSRINTNSAFAEVPVTVGQDAGGNLTVTINTGTQPTVTTYDVTDFYKS